MPLRQMANLFLERIGKMTPTVSPPSLALTSAAIASTLAGAADSLFYRAEAEDDDMLHLIAEVINEQADALRAIK